MKKIVYLIIFLLGVLAGVVSSEVHIFTKGELPLPLPFITEGKEFYDSGALRVKRKGKVQGTFQYEIYFENGNLKEVRNGAYDGIVHVEEYHETGGLKSKYTLIDSILNEMYQEYDKENKRIKFGYYEDGVFHALNTDSKEVDVQKRTYAFPDEFGASYIIEDMEGNPILEKEYKNGKRISKKEYAGSDK